MGAPTEQREEGMKIVSNTGPLIHLGESRALHLLQLAGELHIPPIVEIELRSHLPTWQTPEWITMTRLTEIHSAQAAAWEQVGLLDAGEAEALILVRQIEADWFLTDDAAAHLLAQTLNIEVHGSLGIVLWAAAVGHLSLIEAEQALERLYHSSLWLSARIFAEARDALTKMFES